MVEDEDLIEDLQSCATLGTLGGRHRRTVIAHTKQNNPDLNGTLRWTQSRITVAVISLKKGLFLNLREIMIRSNLNYEAAKLTKKELNFLYELKKIVNFSHTLVK